MAWRPCASVVAWGQQVFLSIWSKFRGCPRATFQDDDDSYGRRSFYATEQADGEDHSASLNRSVPATENEESMTTGGIKQRIKGGSFLIEQRGPEESFTPED